MGAAELHNIVQSLGSGFWAFLGTFAALVFYFGQFQAGIKALLVKVEKMEDKVEQHGADINQLKGVLKWKS